MTGRLILAAALTTIAVAGWAFWPRIERLLSPTQPEEPDTSDGQEEPSGADEGYGDVLHAIAEAMAAEDAEDAAREAHEAKLRIIAAEHQLDLDKQDDRSFAEDIAAFRHYTNTHVAAFTQRMAGLESWLDGWAPGWRRLRLGNVLDDTSEFAMVA
jgi:hypothetical protein